ncbi:uncharacterized protein BJ171DRAFT_249881 [Polychytrium aggregatum]|uniref:uncharacterized protein n=1 Tax=Polychytrium aggregatum TaxID=110093 RepID=UPI0022FDFD65|nr:uncharacterized protein BJ171DRAFT_249881 [Polychytrium aggregatum]KAI9193640.1 hypothetical protein BJ171DRAFT_249881 [Polychytrium aggregatum]
MKCTDCARMGRDSYNTEFVLAQHRSSDEASTIYAHCSAHIAFHRIPSYQTQVTTCIILPDCQEEHTWQCPREYHIHAFQTTRHSHRGASSWPWSMLGMLCVSSMAKLAYHYAKGDGVENNDGIASKWFMKACEHGHLPSQYTLGVRFQNGIGLPIDHVKVARLEKQPNGSIIPIGPYLTNSILDQQDPVLAAKVYSILAARNNAESQVRLGRCYRDGIGVPKNHQEAFFNFRKAAEVKNLTGCFEFGMRLPQWHLCRQGLDQVPQTACPRSRWWSGLCSEWHWHPLL